MESGEKKSSLATHVSRSVLNGFTAGLADFAYVAFGRGKPISEDATEHQTQSGFEVVGTLVGSLALGALVAALTILHPTIAIGAAALSFFSVRCFNGFTQDIFLRRRNKARSR